MKISVYTWTLLIFFGILFIQLFTNIPIFPIAMLIVFASIFGLIIITKFDIMPPSFLTWQKMEKEIAEKIKSELNIDNIKWMQFSRGRKWQMHKYFQKQEKLMRKKGNLFTKVIRPEVAEEWKRLTLEERIRRIDEDDLKQLKAESQKKIKREKKFIEEKEMAKKKAREKELEEKGKILNAEKKQEKKNLEKAKLEKVKREENLERNRILAQKQKQKDLKEIKRKQDYNYKEFIKRELLAKEKRKQLESEAIQELIDLGKINDNYSLQNKREPIPSHVKDAVWKRDKQCCVSCGSSEKLEFDHNIPFSRGGSNTVNNIQILCQKCNRRKSNKII